MHRRSLLITGVVVLALAGAAVAWRQWPASVEVARVQRGPAVEAVYATGAVEPTLQVPVAPRAGGRLVSREVDEGAVVKRGQVLARLEATDLEQTVQELSARARLARSNFERTQALVNEKFLSPAELDRVRIELEAAEAGLRRAQAQRDYAQLVSPSDGVVLRRDGEIGQFIPAGQVVYTLACCGVVPTWRVSAEVDEEDIARVRSGQAVVLRTEALPNQVFDGVVGEITPKGDPVARSYRVRIQFRPPAGDTGQTSAMASLRSGMTMDANIVIARRENVLLVPSTALRGSTAWVLADGRLHKRAVTAGVKGADRTQVTQGLAEGETVVLTPADALRDGQRARISEAAPAASAAAGAASR